MSVKQSHRFSSGSGCFGVSHIHSSGSYKAHSMHGGGYGGLRSSLGGYCGIGGGSIGGGSIGGKNEGMLNVCEKETMQLLNDRLANYLGRVRSLEEENGQFERKIREWYDKQVPFAFPDFNNYYRTIEELQNKILHACSGNANLILQIDNARLTSDDFRNKFESEASFRMGVEGDMNGLRRVLEELNMTNSDQEMQRQNLNEELTFLKKNHAEEVGSLRSQLGARVNVEVDAAPGVDLNRVLGEIRDQYETIVERNRREAENWFLNKSEELNQQISSGANQLQTVQTEGIQMRNTIQGLEIELQSQNSMRGALEGTFADTESRYGGQLSQLQCLINNVESQLGNLRSDLERQSFEYKALMDVKTHLEMEIATYRRLLEGEDRQ
ncbi:hypothetical protein XELAEV_18045883mg [Xenopus laevis]|uniref:IF rod domain-containing protein n=1 Tax=Xenopus laevis TaxID=8355 RepID=A0A974BSM9_XENLA|nr:hypothetical protein XELAEV_18045883mg [Xenopus laevis]